MAEGVFPAEYVLFYPEGGRRWNVRQQADPNSELLQECKRHGERVMMAEVLEAEGIRWLRLEEGGWVRMEHPGFMANRFPGKPDATGYGWHPSEDLTDEELMEAVQDTRVAVPLVNIHSGEIIKGCSRMAQVADAEQFFAALGQFQTLRLRLQQQYEEQQQQPSEPQLQELQALTFEIYRLQDLVPLQGAGHA